MISNLQNITKEATLLKDLYEVEPAYWVCVWLCKEHSKVYLNNLDTNTDYSSFIYVDYHGLPKNFGDPRLFSLYLAICYHRVHP